MQIFPIQKADDPRIAAYFNLKDKQLALNHGLFVVEGEFLVRRLLASSYRTHSVLMTPARYQSGKWSVPNDVSIYLASKEIISHIIGFDFHRGVLALGVRGEKYSHWDQADFANIDRLIVCPEINDVENLGSIMRTAAGLGYEHFLFGESCCDPFARRAIRTSMGTVFKLKIARSEDIMAELKQLKSDHHFEWHAAVLNADAMPLHRVQPPVKVGLVFGSEANGLTADIMTKVDQLVTIPMSLDTDSLNVVVAAGIFLYHYRV